MNPPPINRAQLTRIIGKPHGAIDAMIGKGMPVRDDGKFEVEPTLRWWVKYEIDNAVRPALNKQANELKKIHSQQIRDLKKAISGKGSGPMTEDRLLEAKIRKIEVETKRHETRLFNEENQLVPITAVSDVVENEYSNVKSHLLSVGTKVAPLLIDKHSVNDVTHIVNEHIREALEELSKVEDIELPPPVFETLPEDDE